MDQKRQIFIESELRKAEEAAAKLQTTLSQDQRQKIQSAAAGKYDRQKQTADASIDAEIRALEEKYKRQQMINQGKGKEVAIEEALNRARQQAARLGTTLSSDQEQRIRIAAGRTYDLTHAEPLRTSKSPIQDTYATYGIRSVGGMIAGASRAGTFSTDYAQRSAQTLANMQTQLANIDQKLPGRTEATPVRVQF